MIDVSFVVAAAAVVVVVSVDVLFVAAIDVITAADVPFVCAINVVCVHSCYRADHHPVSDNLVFVLIQGWCHE